MTHVLYSDPIPTVQAHYQRELVDTLAGAGLTAALAPWSRPVEGRRGLVGRAAMLASATANLVDARSTDGPLVQLWPTFGLLEARLWGSRPHDRYVVLHDPSPLRRQYGFSERARAWAARADPRSRPTIVVQSEAALTVARRALPRHRVELALHPVLDRQRTVVKTAEPSVLVAGQFKPSRDLGLLAALGPRLRREGWSARIVGRGWPPVPGWDVDDRFVAESELDTLVGRAWAFVLPYHEYYQSGVAVRALENGTPTIGESTWFLRHLQGSDDLLVAPGAPAEAYVERLAALARGDAPTTPGTFVDYRDRARASWARLLGSTDDARASASAEVSAGVSPSAEGRLP